MSVANTRTEAAPSEGAARKRKNDYVKKARASVSKHESNRLGPPTVIGPPLSDPEYLTFAKFIQLPQTSELFGLRGDASQLLVQLTQERRFQLARAFKGGSTAQKAKWRSVLTDYVRRAYLGDVRGIQYWKRVAKVIWVAYENMLRLKLWAEKARKYEEQRIERWNARAAKERDRQRDRRAKAKARIANSAAK